MKPPAGYTGHVRDLVKGHVVRDPNIEITPDVRILQRTDGRAVIFDRRLPLGEDAGVFDSFDLAAREARRIYAKELAPPLELAKAPSSPPRPSRSYGEAGAYSAATDRDLTPARVTAPIIREKAPSSPVFSRPECPFHYCDTKAPHDACKERCRHAAPAANPFDDLEELT